jgi:hypothetical protein
MSRSVTTPDWIDLLDSIEEYLGDRADAEGNSAADWRPNEAMRLLNELREARSACPEPTAEEVVL